MSPTMSKRDSAGLQTDITQRTGLSFAGSRGPHLASIVEGVLGAHPSATERTSAAQPLDGAVFHRLCEALTVQESFFFREPSRLELLREHVLPAIRERGSHLRAWSAGCARGEEAYTLSMLLTEAGFAGRHDVLGTDLSPAAVASARSGTYGRWAVRGLDEKTLSTYFEGGPGALRVGERFRTRVDFVQHNLLDPLPPDRGQFDLILCRNVLIYFTPEAVRRAAEALTAALAPGGWLLLGISDPPLEGVPGLQKITSARGPVYRRVESSSSCAPGQATAHSRSVGPPAPARVRPTTRVRRARLPEPPVPVPPVPSDLIAAAKSALSLADTPRAVSLARQAWQRSPGDPAVHRLMVQALAEDGRWQESLAAVDRALTSFPEDHRIRELQALVLLETGRTGTAVAAARQAVYLDPGSASAHFVLARAHELLGDDVAAQRARRNGRLVGLGGPPS